MKYFLFLALVVSCGNPHISSSRGGLERSNPPLSADPTCGAGIVVDEFKFYLGDDSELKTLNKCKTQVEETFNSHEDGTVTTVTNDGKEDVTYTIRHQAERDYEPGKAITLHEVFGSEEFPMDIENPISLRGLKGIDRGVNSLDASKEKRDALVWTFSHPISTWGSWMVNLEALHGKAVSLKVFDCHEVLTHQKEITSLYAFIGFASFRSEVCAVSVTAGGKDHAVAVDGFFYTR